MIYSGKNTDNSVGQNRRQNTFPNLYSFKFPLKRPIDKYTDE